MAEPSTDNVILQLDTDYEQTKTEVARYRRASRVIAWATVAVFLGYCIAIYSSISSQWSFDKLEKSGQKETERLAPLVQGRMVDVANRVAPIYQEMLSSKLQEAMPEIQQRAELAVKQSADDIMKSAGDDVDAVIKRVSSKHEKLLERQFPGMSTDRELVALRLQWQSDIQDDTRQIIENFHVKYTRDVGDLQSTLGMFRASHFRYLDKDTLVRYFVHLWLMLLDRHILGKDAQGGTRDR